MEGEQPGELDSNLREGKMGLERGLPVTLKCSLSAFLTIYLTLPSHINIHADARNHVTQVNTCCKLLFHYFPGQLEVALKKMRLQFDCLGAGIRTLSDSVLSSGRLWHIISHWSWALTNTFPFLWTQHQVWSLLTIYYQSDHVSCFLLTSPQMPPCTYAQSVNLAQLFVSLNEFSVVSRHCFIYPRLLFGSSMMRPLWYKQFMTKWKTKRKARL